MSVGGPSSIGALQTGLTGSLNRRSSRLPYTSSSPLHGRGSRREGSLELPGLDDEDELLGGRLHSDDSALEEFQLYGPAAAVDTQKADESQWMSGVLAQESRNFLEYVKTELDTRKGGDEDELLGGEFITFDELLPPTQHTKIVAAQAFHHLLALATRGLLQVKQDVGYEPIQMSVVAGEVLEM
jgi:meiotic recombination protein REC8